MSTAPPSGEAPAIQSAPPRRPVPAPPRPNAKPQKKRLSMSVINFWLDAALLGVLVTLGWEAAVLQFLFPAPTLATGWTLFGLTFDQWHDIEFATLCTFALGILLHVMLHWNWVCSVIPNQILKTGNRPDEGKQTIYGVLTLMVLLHLIGAGVILSLFFLHSPPPV
ncbi:MAG: hypothetical protein ACP5XB_14210 [Isosphaeraceae bacterium]